MYRILTKFKPQIKYSNNIFRSFAVLSLLLSLFTLSNKNRIIQTKSSCTLDCLNSFLFDNQRNQYIKSIIENTSTINGKQLAQALRTYTFDNGRTQFISLIVEKINDMNIDEITECLNTFSFDKAKDEFLEAIQSKIKIDIMQIGKINECFSFGSKNIRKLFANNNLVTMVTIRKQKISVEKFLQSLGNMNDDTKFAILNNVWDCLEKENDSKICDTICENFKDIKIIEKIFQDYDIEEKVSEQYIQKISNQVTKFWINGKEISLNTKNNMEYTYPCGILKIDASKGINNCTIIFSGRRGSYSQLSGVSLEGLRLSVGESGIQMIGRS